MSERCVWRLLSLVLVLTVPTSPVVCGGDWFTAETILVAGEAGIEGTVINGPPNPLPGFHRPVVESPKTTADRASVTLTVPAYDWSSGCSTTSASMIAAYYDRATYPNIYTGPTNGGVMPLDNSIWPQWTDSNGDTYYQCPLSASRQGLDGLAARGHVDDYWTGYNDAGPDPYDGNWTEHTAADCTGDFMKTNRWYTGQTYNVDGATTFYNFTDGAALYAADMEGYGIHTIDGGYGFKLFYESRGYTVDTMYNQHILGYNGNTQGFTWVQYMAEIDAGHPVMIHVDGHTMVGVGYNTVGQQVYLHDTWDFSTHSMTWGDSYGGMAHTGVTIVRLGLITLVDLTRFEAKASWDRVRLEWETASERDNAGFNIWRSESKDGQYKRINKSLIPAEGGISWGATYQCIDERVSSGKTYYYKLEDLNFAGDSTLHGPVAARVRPLGAMIGQGG